MAREVQVARLIAQYRSEKEIAVRLVISRASAKASCRTSWPTSALTSRAKGPAWVAASHPDDDWR
jgi:hypothetical protein